MRQESRSYWVPRLALGLVFAALLALVVWGVVKIGQGSDQTVPASTHSPTVSEDTPNVAPVNQPENDPELEKAVLAFVEAYNLPASDHRNELLKAMSTPEGYDMVYSDPDAQLKFYESQGIEFSEEELAQLREKLGLDVTIQALPENTTIEVEPFDDEMSVVSVYTVPTVRIIRGDKIVNNYQLPGIMTSWIKEADGWKLALIQY